MSAAEQDEDGFIEDEKPQGMTMVVLTYRDILNIERKVYESLEQFTKRCQPLVGVAEPDEMAASLEDYYETEKGVSMMVEVFCTEWETLQHARFALEAEAADLEVRRYHGRFHYDGPAVNADSVEDVTRHITVSCQHDSMGRGVVVYPR